MQQKGKTSDATSEFQKARELWKDADTDLPELKMIQTQLAEAANHR